MQIKKITCKQFAGIQNKEWEFLNGLNILCGKNETGKSTMIDLMYSLLFEEIKVRSNGDFRKIYFPKKAEGISGDFIKGELVFETENGTYILNKKWDSKGECELTLPDGSAISNINKIEEIIGKELIYEKGTFNEIVFASQKRTMTLMKGLFLQTKDDKKLTGNNKENVIVKQELSSIVTKAVMETGGISINNLEMRLKDILKQYNEQWDFDADEPEGGAHKRGIDNKWKCAESKKAENGEQAIILRAYYEKEELKAELEKEKQAEDAVDEVNKKLREAKEKKREAKNKRECFLQCKNVLEQFENIRNLERTVRESFTSMTNDLNSWPEAEKNCKYAQTLNENLEAAQYKKIYNDVKPLKDEYEEKYKEFSKLREIKDEDVNDSIELERSIENLSSQLRGLNITAKIAQIGNVMPEVYSIDTGERMDIIDDTVNIEEAVTIRIPEVMELQLIPNGIDVEDVTKQITDKRKIYQKILERYSAKNATELREKQSEYNNIKHEIIELKNNIEKGLKNHFWEEIEKKYLALPEQIDTIEEIERKIEELCGENSLDHFMGEQNAIVKRLEKNYVTKEKLKRSIDQKKDEMEEYQDKINSLTDIPEEYKEIDDLETYDKTLKDDVESCEENIHELNREVSEKEKELLNQTSEEYSELLKEKCESFEKKKATYLHWKHIAETVKEVKNTLANNPMEDIEDKFKNYLSMLSNGRIVLNDFNDHMDSSISSGNNQLAYEILSEGTRDTIALAFRLAMLEHLYPNGGGLAVFDDPFTDMDPDRTRLSCQLIQKFAENNQVIFVTCDPKYAEMMKGNVEEFQ